jgi:AcrR family transcriptional regulator
MMRDALTAGHPRELLEQAAIALLDYVEQSSDGFRILVRDSPLGSASGSFVSIISDIASRVEHILVAEFRQRGYDAKNAPMYAQMLVGMVGTTGQWWLDARKPERDEVAAHLCNLAWNGLHGLEKSPRLITRP